MVGNGAYPYSLAFQRTFRTGSVGAAPDAELYHPTDPLFGESGWTSNLQHRASTSSDGMAAFGGEDPRAAAQTIVAIRALLSVSPNGASDTATLQRQIVASLTAWWWTRSIVQNTVTIEQGADSRSFTRLASGAWAPPRGRDESLEVAGGRTMGDPTIGPEYWSYKTICIKLTGADRSVSSYGATNLWAAPYNMGSCPTGPIGSATIEANFKGLRFLRQSFPYGVQVDRTADGGLSNNLGRSLTVTGGATAPTQFAFTVADAEDATRNVDFAGGGDVQVPEIAGQVTVTEVMNLSVTDPENHVWTYDAVGGFRAFAPTQPNLAFLTFDQRPGVRGAMEAFRDANRNETEYFTGASRAAATEDPAGNSSYIRYDEFGQPVWSMDRRTMVSTTAYDAHRRVTRVTQPEGNAEVYTYDARHNRLSTTRKPKPGGTPPPDIVTSATYNATFNVPATETDGEGHTTTYAYNATTGTLTSITGPNPGGGAPVTSFTWNSLGQRLTRTDPTGIVLRYTYDGENQLDTVTNAYGTAVAATTAFDYDAAGDITSLTDPRGKVHTATWNRMRQITQWTAPAATGAQTQWTYDADGLVATIKQATGLASPNQWATTTVAYEPTARVRSVTDPDGRTTRFQYDALNRLILSIDPEGRSTGRTYDPEGNVLVERRGDGAPSPDAIAYATRSYTDNGQVRTFKDANPAETGYRYDAHDRLWRTLFADPFNGVSNIANAPATDSDYEELAYDDDDNVTSRRTRSGASITASYDVLDRMIQKVVPSTAVSSARTATFTYDLAGRQDVVTETGGHSLDWTYDGAGRASSVAISGPQWTGAKTVAYQYDAGSNRTRLTWPDGYYVTYAYDDLNRLDTATQTVSGVSTLLADYGYDPLSRRTSAALDAAGAGGSITAAFTAGGDLTSLAHAWTAGGGVTVTYAYDRGHRLQDETFSAAAYRWDPAGTGTATYGADFLNRYDAVPSDNSLAYDGNQNLTGVDNWTFGYDPENRMVSADRSGTVRNVDYDYDPLGRRVRKTVGGDMTLVEAYLLDGDEEIAEYDGSGTLLRRFVPSDATDAPIVQIDAGGTRRYFRVNRQGTVMAMTGSSGALQTGSPHGDGEYEYDPYGAPESTDVEVGGTPFRYTGRRYDSETGLYYYRARYYSPVWGRFMQVDPIGYEGGANLYLYVMNSPPNGTDPLGLQEECNSYGCSPLADSGTRQAQEDFRTELETNVDPELRRDVGTGAAAIVGTGVGCGLAPTACAAVAKDVAYGAAATAAVSTVEQAGSNGRVDPGRVVNDVIESASPSAAGSIGGRIAGTPGKVAGAAAATRAQGGSDAEVAGAAIGAVVSSVIPGTKDDAILISVFRKAAGKLFGGEAERQTERRERRKPIRRQP